MVKIIYVIQLVKFSMSPGIIFGEKCRLIIEL